MIEHGLFLVIWNPAALERGHDVPDLRLKVHCFKPFKCGALSDRCELVIKVG